MTDIKNLKSVKEMMKKKRTDLNLTSMEAVGKIGISQSFLSDIERGHRLPGEENIEAIAKAYSLTKDEKENLIVMVALEKSPELVRNKIEELQKENEKLRKELKMWDK